jgi:hypothetical protein
MLVEPYISDRYSIQQNEIRQGCAVRCDARFQSYRLLILAENGASGDYRTFCTADYGNPVMFYLFFGLRRKLQTDWS